MRSITNCRSAATTILPLLRLFQRQQVVDKDQAVVEAIIGADTMGDVAAARTIFQQDERFQPRAALFADPGQFQFLSTVGHSCAALSSHPAETEFLAKTRFLGHCHLFVKQ
jgi:hypothetical protein